MNNLTIESVRNIVQPHNPTDTHILFDDRGVALFEGQPDDLRAIAADLPGVWILRSNEGA